MRTTLNKQREKSLRILEFLKESILVSFEHEGLKKVWVNHPAFALLAIARFEKYKRGTGGWSAFNFFTTQKVKGRPKSSICRPKSSICTPSTPSTKKERKTSVHKHTEYKVHPMGKNNLLLQHVTYYY